MLHFKLQNICHTLVVPKETFNDDGWVVGMKYLIFKHIKEAAGSILRSVIELMALVLEFL